MQFFLPKMMSLLEELWGVAATAMDVRLQDGVIGAIGPTLGSLDVDGVRRVGRLNVSLPLQPLKMLRKKNK